MGYVTTESVNLKHRKLIMVKINSQPILDAIEKHEYPKTKIAFVADSNPATLEKILSGDPDVSLSSIHKIASYLGMDVEVCFKPPA